VDPPYKETWTAHIPLKIKIFLWLVQKNKILTNDNLIIRGWIGDDKCIFCNVLETVSHLFIHCPLASCIWNWISHYNNFNFHMFCNSIEELWIIDNYILFKDTNLCEILRAAILWVIWKERNRLIFHRGNHKSIRTLGGYIISLIKYWCQLKKNNYVDTLHHVIPFNTNESPLQCITENLSLLHIEEDEWSDVVIELN
jgi:zinc-binding in reverse transcriptase